MLAEPNGAADTGPTGTLPDSVPFSPTTPGKNGAKCARTPTGPTPGPPPPCGIQNVLCKFKCETSEPNLPGCATPTMAFIFAPSIYTWPPASWIRSQMPVMASSKTPWVEGYVTISAARRSPACAILACKSSKSTLPCASDFTTTTSIPTILAEAGFVPCADEGIRQISRCDWPLAR